MAMMPRTAIQAFGFVTAGAEGVHPAFVSAKVTLWRERGVPWARFVHEVGYHH